MKLNNLSLLLIGFALLHTCSLIAASSNSCFPQGISGDLTHGSAHLHVAGLTWVVMPTFSNGTLYPREFSTSLLTFLEEVDESGRAVATETLQTLSCEAQVVESTIASLGPNAAPVAAKTLEIRAVSRHSPHTTATVRVQMFAGDGIIKPHGQDIQVDRRTVRVTTTVENWKFQDPTNRLRLPVGVAMEVIKMEDVDIHTQPQALPKQVEIQTKLVHATYTFDGMAMVDGQAVPYHVKEYEEKNDATWDGPGAMLITAQLLIPAGDHIEWSNTMRFQIANDTDADAVKTEEPTGDQDNTTDTIARNAALIAMAGFIMVLIGGGVFVLTKYFKRRTFASEAVPLKDLTPESRGGVALI